MTEALQGGGAEPPKVRRLHDAMRKVRIASAERDDALHDLHEAERARLGMLAEELAGVVRELPEDEEFFLFAVTPGMPPRLWVDPTTHVVIGRDRRTYRFLKDTRLGRTVLAETADLTVMADAVTGYVAERLLERERALEGDWLEARHPRTAPAAERRSSGRGGELAGWMIVAFLLGIVVGAVGLIAYAWLKIPGF